MKFSTTLLFAATATAVSLPREAIPDGAEQFPSIIGFGGSSAWSEFPANSQPYSSPYQYNPYSSNQYPPYPPNQYPPNQYPPNPYSSNPYGPPNPYSQPPNPYSPPPPPPQAPRPPVPKAPAGSNNANDPNAPIIPQSAADVPTQVTIDKTSYSGNGCPAGSVSTLISPDKTVVTFGFDVFQATIGPGSDPAGKQKNCQLHLGLKYPSGYQMSIMTATYHGYVRLDAGVVANFISSYYFSQAAEKTAMTRTTLQGPEYKSGKTYTKSDSIANESVVWSPCGANGILNVNNRIALTSPNAQAAGEISNDDATLKFEQKLRIQWRKCNGVRRDVAIEGAPDMIHAVLDTELNLD